METKEVIEAIKTLRKYKTETNQIEAKDASGGFPKKCYDTISSFSNKYGGMLSSVKTALKCHAELS